MKTLLSIGSFVALLALGALAWGVFNVDDNREVAADPFPHAVENVTRIEGWVPHWSNQQSLTKRALKAGFTDLMFFNGAVEEGGKITLKRRKRLAEALKESGKARTWLTIISAGVDFSADLEAHGREVLKAWRASGCQNLDLDYESMSLERAKALSSLLTPLAKAMRKTRAEALLSVTLQPCDEALRPDQIPVYQAMLKNPDLARMRFMCYDSHWKSSLPGAWYPEAAYQRLLRQWGDWRDKLSIGLPLYGYDWARPEDVSMPRASVVTLSDALTRAAKESWGLAWAKAEGEAVWRYKDAGNTKHYVNTPTWRGLEYRVQGALKHGVSGIAFWHLGCADLEQVHSVADQQDSKPAPQLESKTIDSWEALLAPWKKRVCKTVIAREGDTFHTLAKAHGVKRFTLIRFNEDLYGKPLAGKTIYFPLPINS